MNREKVRSVIDADRDELIGAIREIVAIPSVGGGPTNGAPFGVGPRAALDKFEEIAKRLGFRAWIYKDQVGIAELGDESLPEMAAALAHLDVVPTGEGWSCDPWQGKIENGFVYGRGVADDKGPAISVLYAMKALRDCGVKLKRRVRLLVGTNEESGSAAIADYVKSGQELPVAGFTPDCDFPLIFAEKGIITQKCYAPFAPSGAVQVLSIDAGVAPNSVPDKAVALLKVAPEAVVRVDRAVEEYLAPRGAKLACEKLENGEYKLTMEGVAYHGAQPWRGSNAASSLIKLLRLMGIGGEQGESLEKIDKAVGDYSRGENLGVMLYDDVSGFSSLCWGTCKTEDDKLMFTLNYRYPVTYKLADVRKKFFDALASFGFEFTPVEGGEPLYVPEDSELVKKLLSVYVAETGDTVSRPKAIGGGTYAKELPNTVAFGNAMPGENNQIHEVDENWSIEHILIHTKIMAAALVALAEEDSGEINGAK